MIVATDIELRAGARLLLEGASFQVAAGDRIGLVGRNGAGKTTLAKVGPGRAQPAAGSVRRSGAVGYLPQDPRTGDLDTLAIDRVLSARGLDQLRADLPAAGAPMARGGQHAPPCPPRRARGPPPLRAARGAARGARRVRRGVTGRLDHGQPGPARPGAAPAAAHPLRGAAPPGGAGPDPVLRFRDPAAG